MMVTGNNLETLLDKILKIKGMDLYNYKTSFIKRRLETRLRETETKDYRKYAQYLDEHPEEYEKLFGSLSINVTEFFRDSHVFESLTKKVVPLLEQETSFREIKILSVGCATGEETYSIAIKMKESNSSNSHFKIWGLDINKEAIQYAKDGEFNSVKNTSPSILHKHFQQTENGTYKINESIKRHTEFMVGNIMDFNSTINYDIVFCRNLLMYLEKGAQRKIFEKFYELLRPNGFLVLGSSETIIGKPSEMFEAVMIPDRIYKKRSDN